MVARSALLFLSRQEGLKDFATKFKPFQKMTTRFVAGEDIETTVASIRDLNAIGCTATFDHLNEGVTSEAEMAGEVREYKRILARIEETGIRSNVSIKLTQFGLAIDPELAYFLSSGSLECISRTGAAGLVTASCTVTLKEFSRGSKSCRKYKYFTESKKTKTKSAPISKYYTPE